MSSDAMRKRRSQLHRADSSLFERGEKKTLSILALFTIIYLLTNGGECMEEEKVVVQHQTSRLLFD